MVKTTTMGLSTLRILAALGASAVVAVAPAAAKSKPTNVKLACAAHGGGLLHYVAKVSDCPTSRGRLVHFPGDFPVHACKSKSTPHELFRVSDASKCKAPEHPNTRALTLPGANDIKLCIGAAKGTLRVVGKYSRCKPPDRRGVLTRLPSGRTTNVPPVVDTSAGSTQYTEGGAGQTVDAALNVSDANDTHLEGATVAIGSGFRAGDELLFVDQKGIGGSYDASTGVLTITGHATTSAYRDALRSVRFRTALDNPGTARVIVFSVDDGTALSALARKGIDITAVNDAPRLTASPDPRFYTEGDGAQLIDPGLTLSDPDSASISGATVRIAKAFVSADDELSFVNKLGITGAYNDSTGVLTLTGTASLASYETALRSVRYENVSNNPSGAKQIAFQVTDAGSPPSASNFATRIIKLLGDDDPSVVTTSAGSTQYDISAGTPVAVDPALTVTDVDDANLEGASVGVVTGFEAGDVLAFTDQLGITGSYDGGTGVLTLTGTASKADYQTALRSVTFSTSNGSPLLSKTVGFLAFDGEAPPNEATKNIALSQ
jgi:hypothetical protein